MKTGYLTLIFALACAACTPRFYPPKVDVPDGYLYGEGFPRDTAALASDWWRLFGDTVLDNLVQRALENNRDVAVAASRVEEARQNLGVVRAQFGDRVDHAQRGGHRSAIRPQTTAPTGAAFMPATWLSRRTGRRP